MSDDTEAANARCIRDLKQRLAYAEKDRDQARGWANSWHHVLDAICVILEVQVDGADEVAGVVRSKFEEISARLAEAELERDRYASDAGERAAKLDAALADVERLTKERDRWHVMAVQQVDFKIAANDRAKAAEAALAKAQQERDEALSALHFLCDGDVSYHDAEIRIPCGTHGEAIRRMRIARAALAPDGKTEAELRHDCAASGRHDHDGCDCSAEELARRAALAPEGKTETPGFEPLGAEFEAVWDGNRSALYEEDRAAPEGK